jgi:Zn finger protein HypA/HybF involved in hydrogenase expression
MEFQINIDELKLKCDNCQKRYAGSEANGTIKNKTQYDTCITFKLKYHCPYCNSPNNTLFISTWR